MAEARAYAFAGQGGEPAEYETAFSRRVRRSFRTSAGSNALSRCRARQEFARQIFRINLARLSFHIDENGGGLGVRLRKPPKLKR
jgi:hypothetical protein